MTTETAPIDPQALRFNREQLRISQRELGRRVAERLGRAGAARAIGVRLHRIENGDAISEEDRELLDALAAELAVGVDDLGTPPVWIWIKMSGGRPGIVELAMRMPAWTSPENAYQGRDWLALRSKGNLKPFEDAHLVPMRFRALSHDTLDANYPRLTERQRLLLLEVDPDPEGKLAYLAGLNKFQDDDELPEGTIDSFVDIIEKTGLVAEIVELHELALQRLELSPPEYPGLAASWRRREERYYALLERHAERLRAKREQILAEGNTQA